MLLVTRYPRKVHFLKNYQCRFLEYTDVKPCIKNRTIFWPVSKLVGSFIYPKINSAKLNPQICDILLLGIGHDVQNN